MRILRETFVAGVYAACVGVSSKNMVKLLLLKNFCECETFVVTLTKVCVEMSSENIVKLLLM